MILPPCGLDVHVRLVHEAPWARAPHAMGIGCEPISINQSVLQLQANDERTWLPAQNKTVAPVRVCSALAWSSGVHI